jgi:DNA end-binding protein Ku
VKCIALRSGRSPGSEVTSAHHNYSATDISTPKGISQPRVSKDMAKLAEHILDSKAGRFNPDKFKDQYENALKKLVRRKASGKKIEVVEPEEKKGNVIDLMEALRNSVKGKKATSARKRAARKRSTKRRKAA